MLTHPFGHYLQNLGYTKNNCRSFCRYVEYFLIWLGPSSGFTTADIQSYYEYLQHRPSLQSEGAISAGYIYLQMYVLRLYFNWLEQTGQLSQNPISVLKFPLPENPVREPLSQQQVQQLFAVCLNLREQALLHLYYSCGLRKSEGQSLNIRDISFKGQTLYVRNGKGSRRRAIPLSLRVARELEAYYLQERITSPCVEDEEAFLLGVKGHRISERALRQLLKKLLERAGITSPVSLHHLRHSIATHLLENGLSLENIRSFLGHRLLETTQVYVKVADHLVKKLKT